VFEMVYNQECDNPRATIRFYGPMISPGSRNASYFKDVRQFLDG